MTSSSKLGTALVTGASSGIGEVYADRLAHRGYDLVLVARNVERLTALAARLSAETGRKVETIAADLAVPAELAKVEARLKDDGAITLLVNNAGLANTGPLLAADPAALESMLTVNVVALTRLAAVGATAFAARQRGAIINLSSAMAFIDTPNTAAYAASKAYVLNFTLSLDLEVKPHGVQVQAVLPGYTRTPMLASRSALPAEIVMDVDELVDAALVGFDQGELVTIPSLPDAGDYAAWFAARQALYPNLSRDHAAPRYGVSASRAA
jgi:short-subunit dehydrogenase